MTRQQTLTQQLHQLQRQQVKLTAYLLKAQHEAYRRIMDPVHKLWNEQRRKYNGS